MRFNIDIEMTPEELRKVLGLPDVQKFHEELLNKVREQMEAGVEGYEPLALFQPFLTGGLNSMETFQKALFGAMMNGFNISQPGAGSGDRRTDKG